jgi:hypothetical protein
LVLIFIFSAYSSCFGSKNLWDRLKIIQAIQEIDSLLLICIFCAKKSNLDANDVFLLRKTRLRRQKGWDEPGEERIPAAAPSVI